jgi:glycosyltransferase involved in cell wall biosynthesis
MTVFFLLPGSIDTRTGGSIYDRRIVEALRARGWTVEVRELDDSFPAPTVAALDQAACVLADMPDGSTVLVDGLAFGAMPAHAEREASRLRFVALVHQTLAAEIGIDPPTAALLEASERRALAVAARIVVTGHFTIKELEPYGVTGDRLVVVEPGTDPAPQARGSGGSQPRLLAVGTLKPGKGYELLMRALAAVPHRDWHLTVAGSLDRDPATAARVRAVLRKEKLEDRVSLAGELDDEELAAAYDRADLFVLATLHETYGMAVAEAVARGLPVVSTLTGAIPEVVGSDGGVLVPPGDEQALARALTSVLIDARLRQRLADGARHRRAHLPTWDDAAERMAAVLNPQHASTTR